MRLPNVRRALCGLLFCIPLTAAKAQTVWYVNDDAQGANTGTSWGDAYTDLHSALAAAQSGDQIWVAAGRYVGNFTLALGVELYGGFAGTESELTQRDWTANPTILDGNQTGSVVVSPSGATGTTRIDGFLIMNGSGTVLDPHPYMNGGGLYMYNSSPTIANNKIVGNNADCGGGLFLFNGSDPTIAKNTIRSNSAQVGGGMFLHASSPTIANNAISGNSAFAGGGLYLYYSSPTISNNTITGNNSQDYGTVSLLASSSPTIANTIVAFNSSGIYGEEFSSPVLRNNCVFGNGEYDYSGLADPTGTDGNISANPELADTTYGDVHIQPGSPCVNAGNNAEAFGSLDIDGQPRIQPAGGAVDVGADESDGTAWSPGPRIIVHVRPTGDDAHDGSNWSLAKRSVQAGINAASALGGEVWVRGGTYYERITLLPYAYVFGGFAGTETVRSERNWGANITALDGQQQGSVVTAQWQYGAVSGIDGFTITNGRADSGGGLYVRGSSPTIVNNTITGNFAYSSGGGLYVGYYSSSTIAKNAITGNSAHSYGGGLFLSGSSATIADNTITGNNANEMGGGLFLSGSSATIANNTISANIAHYDGGGMYLGYSSPTIASTIVAFNSSGVQQDVVFPGTPSLRYNCVYGNAAYNYGSLLDPTGTDGNISADPAFVRNPSDGGNGWGDDPGTPDVDEGANDDYGDLRLRGGSPCIDSGDNAAVPADTLDLDGDGNTTEPLPFDLAGAARFVDDPLTTDTGSGTPPIVDMGAFEHPMGGDCDLDGVLGLDDQAKMSGCMAGPGAATPAECGCADVDLDGYVDLRDFAGFQRVFAGQ